MSPFTRVEENHSAFYRTMTLLVVASPCALVLSIPSAVLAAIAWGAKHGILFRGGAAVEKLAGINHRCIGQDRHAHDWRTARGNGRELSSRSRARNCAACRFRWNACRPTRWPGPSSVTANSTNSKPSALTISSPSRVRAWRGGEATRLLS